MADAGIARYYDRLNRWNAVARALGYGRGRGTLTAHRALADPLSNGAPTTTRLHDVLIDALPRLEAPLVLDAGCGPGGTLLALASRLQATCLGVTLSENQATTAMQAARDAGFGSRVRVLVQSYDTPPPGPYDLVVAIESLAHSPSPRRSVAALVQVLGPRGVFVVVDDMPEALARASADLQTFMSGWQCPALWGQDDYLRAFAESGLDVIVDRDLTGETRPRRLSAIRALEVLNRAVSWTIPSLALREVLQSHFGGLALERLTRLGLMRYRMIVARRRVKDADRL